MADYLLAIAAWVAAIVGIGGMWWFERKQHVDAESVRKRALLAAARYRKRLELEAENERLKLETQRLIAERKAANIGIEDPTRGDVERLVKRLSDIEP